MPATVPACCGSKCRSRLILGKARDMFVRSINAIVYMMRATGMMRIQRVEIGGGFISVPASRSCAAFIKSTNPPRLLTFRQLPTGVKCGASPHLAPRCCLWLYLVDSHFGVLIFVVRDGKIVVIQFWDKNPRFRAKAAGNSRQQSVMVGILLFENFHKLISRQVNALMLSVITHIVNQADGRQTGDHLAAVRVQHNQLPRCARNRKQTVVGFVKSHGHVLLVSRREGPGCRECRLGTIENSNSVLTRNIEEHAWPGLFEHDRFDVV